jgi:hypothetical protein
VQKFICSDLFQEEEEKKIFFLCAVAKKMKTKIRFFFASLPKSTE